METTAFISAQQRSGPGAVLDAAVIVAALGYFVDIYDLILVPIVRRPSLTALGVAGDALVSEGVSILYWQGAMAIGAVWFVLALASAVSLPETFGVDLDCVER
jgi:putative MFS transporter